MCKYGTLAILLFGAAVFSQDTASSSQTSGSPNATTFPVLSLLLSARAKGGPVELAVADLEVKEDGKPARIQQVRKLDLPIRYCVLFDVSGSEHDQFKQQQGRQSGCWSR